VEQGGVGNQQKRERERGGGGYPGPQKKKKNKAKREIRVRKRDKKDSSGGMAEHLQERSGCHWRSLKKKGERGQPTGEVGGGVSIKKVDFRKKKKKNG